MPENHVPILKLSSDVFMLIFRHLSIEQLVLLLFVNKRFKKEASDPRLWEPLIKKRFGDPIPHSGYSPQFFISLKNESITPLYNAYNYYRQELIKHNCFTDEDIIKYGQANGSENNFSYFTAILRYFERIDILFLLNSIADKLKTANMTSKQDRLLLAVCFCASRNLKVAQHYISEDPTIFTVANGLLLPYFFHSPLDLAQFLVKSQFSAEIKKRIMESFCKSMVVVSSRWISLCLDFAEITTYQGYFQEATRLQQSLIDQRVLTILKPTLPPPTEDQKKQREERMKLLRMESTLNSLGEFNLSFWIENFPYVVKLSGFSPLQLLEILESTKFNTGRKISVANQRRNLLGCAATGDWECILHCVEQKPIDLLGDKFFKLFFDNCKGFDAILLENKLSESKLPDTLQIFMVKEYCQHLLSMVDNKPVRKGKFAELQQCSNLKSLYNLAQEYECLYFESVNNLIAPDSLQQKAAIDEEESNGPRP